MPRTSSLSTMLSPDVADAELAGRAAAGEGAAFEELYRRHAPAAWRVAQAVSHNADDAQDAVAEAFTKVFQALPAGRLSAPGSQFRPYLLTAARNAAIDGLRRTGRLRPSDDIDTLDAPTMTGGPTDKLLAGADAAMIAIAFRGLPERWRAILWLTEVEGVPPREAAKTLGLSANGVAQLAVRARAGLRERYLQAHLQAHVEDGCKPFVDLLGAYAAGGLAARDIAKVDQHIAGCADCRQRLAELEDLGTSLRRIALPLPAGLAALTAGKLAMTLGGVGGAAALGANQVGAVASVAAAPPGPLTAMWRDPDQTLARIHKPLRYVAIGIVAVGIMGMSIVGRPDPRGEQSQIHARPVPFSVTPTPPSVSDPNADTTLAIALGNPGRAQGGAVATPATATDPGPGASGPAAAPAPKPPAPKPPADAPAVLQANVAGADVVGLAVGDACTGVMLAGEVVGCAPDGPTDGSTLSITTRGDLLGDNEVSI